MAFQKLLSTSHPLITEDTHAEHRIAARIHAKRRASERYGIDLSDEEIDNHERAIRNGRSKRAGFNGRRSFGNYCELHIIHTDTRTFYAVYRVRIKRIVTYLDGPHQWLGKFAERAA